MKKHLRIISAILILVLCMTSFSFAATSETNLDNNNSMAVTESASLIRMGGNWQLWDGVPSAYASQSWSSWTSQNFSFDAMDYAALFYDMGSCIIAGYAGWWSVIGMGFLAYDTERMGSETFFDGIIATAPLVNGVKTSYAKIYESHASSYSGTQQFSKVYIKYYTNSARTILAGTSETLFVYAWPTGSSPEQ